MIRATVDRIEGEWIVLVAESGPVFQLPLIFGPGWKEGDIVSLSLTRDEPGEEDAKDRIDGIRKGLNQMKSDFIKYSSLTCRNEQPREGGPG